MAEEVGQQLPATKNLHESLSRAEEFAARRKHTVVGLDHFMLALGQDPDALGTMLACRVEVKALCADLLRKLGPEARILNPNAVPPSLDATVQNLLAHASTAARDNGAVEYDGGHVLSAIINGEGGFAAHRILEKHGMVFDEATMNTHARSKAKAVNTSDHPAVPPVKAKTEDYKPEEQPAQKGREEPAPKSEPEAAVKTVPDKDQAFDIKAGNELNIGSYNNEPENKIGKEQSAASILNDKEQNQALVDDLKEVTNALNQQLHEASQQNNHPARDAKKETAEGPVKNITPVAENNQPRHNKRPDFGRRTAPPPHGHHEHPAPPHQQREGAPQPHSKRGKEQVALGREHEHRQDMTPSGQPLPPHNAAQHPAHLAAQQNNRARDGQHLRPVQQPGLKPQSLPPGPPPQGRVPVPEDTSRDPETLASMAPERAAPRPQSRPEQPESIVPPPHPEYQDKAKAKGDALNMPPEIPGGVKRENGQTPNPDNLGAIDAHGQKRGEEVASNNGRWQSTIDENAPIPHGVRPVGAQPLRGQPLRGGQQGGLHMPPPHLGDEHQTPKDGPSQNTRQEAVIERQIKTPPDSAPPPAHQMPQYPPQRLEQGASMDQIATSIKRNQASLQHQSVEDQVIENVPKVMRVDKLHYVEVRVARFTDAEMEFDEEGYGLRAKTERKPYTKAITVHLTGPDGQFLIDSANAATQWCELHRSMVDDADFAIWRWRVLPRKAGVSKLRLDVTVRATGDNGLSAEIPVQPSKSFEIKVTPNYGRLFKRFAAIALLFGLGFVLAKYGPTAYESGVEKVTEILSDNDDEL